MNWDDVQKGLKARGELVFAMDQAQTVVQTQPGPWGSAYDGYCIGLAATWISLSYQGKDFPIDGNMVCDNPPLAYSTLAQNLSDSNPLTDWKTDWDAALGPFVCATSKHLFASRDDRPSSAFLCEVVFKAYGCYGITMVRNGGAHAIAMRQSRDNRFHIFDANYGHSVAKGPDAFRGLVKWYLDKTGYATKYGKRVAIIGVTPPINHSHH
jgi:hypothetical protein